MSNHVYLLLNKLPQKFGLIDNTFLMLQMKELNSELPMRKLCIAFTILLESNSKMTCVNPLCSNSCNASSKAIASPSIIEHLPYDSKRIPPIQIDPFDHAKSIPHLFCLICCGSLHLDYIYTNQFCH
jgi:hypothetical protein